MRLVVPFGFYGWGNIGDEATLQGFARLVSQHQSRMQVWVASRNPFHTARVEPSFSYYNAVGRDPRRWLAKYCSAAQAVVGGTPIMDVLGKWPLSEVAPLVDAAYKQGKPIAFVGSGTEKLQSEESRYVVSHILALKVQHWSVRCQRDKERLIDYGVSPESITVAADLAWMLDPVTTDFGKRYLKRLGLAENGLYIGVNVNNEAFMLKQEPRLFEKLGRFLDVLVEQYGVSILFLCNEVREGDMFDKAANLKILAAMTHKGKATLAPNEYLTPQQMMSIIKCCNATVSTRLHFCIFSALQGVPFLALLRSAKASDLCWDLNWNYAVNLCDLRIDALLELFSEMEDDQVQLVENLRRQVRQMRERTLRNGIVLDALHNRIG